MDNVHQCGQKTLLKEEISVGIQDRHIRGFIDIHLLRHDLELEVEFITIMRFNSLDSVCELAGENYETVVVPMQARKLLPHFDGRSQLYEIVDKQSGEL